MLSKLTSTITNNLYFVSRQKVLMKRRKITSKKQKVAKKKFLEENPNRSFTNQLKILQIQKQLDRKVNKNHHLNELMDELFYPDVRYANQKILEQNLLKMSTNPQENPSSRSKLNISSEQDYEIEQASQFDELIQQIYLCQIPSQLFQIYLKNAQFFTHRHLSVFFERLQFYFKNREKIQQRVTYKWKQSLQKLKLTDIEKKKRKRCPYVFIEQDELIRDEEWNKVVKDINRKISSTVEQIRQRFEDDRQQTKEDDVVDQSFYSLENNCDLLLQIKSVANYLPEELFDLIIKKTFAIINLNEKMQASQENLPILSHQQKVKLLRVFSLKTMTKSTLTKSLYIQQPELSQKQQEKIISIGKEICEDVLRFSKCSADDLGAVIQSSKGHYKFVDSELLELSKSRMMQFLSSTDLQRTINYLRIFWQNGKITDTNFIQVLVFDIYRKLPHSVSKNHLISLSAMIKDSRIYFKESKININLSAIYPRLAETITKYLNNGQLTHEELKSFVDSIYNNYPLYKVDSRSNVLQMITTAIVKMGEGFKLQEISHLLFKTTVMGHRSKIFNKYVFERYQKEYKKLMKQYKEAKVQLIADKNAKNLQPHDQDDNLPSMNEVLLEESLILVLWSFIVSFNTQTISLPLSEILEIYPLYIQSQDPMVSDLIEDLNVQLKQLNFFPLIKNKDIMETKTMDNRRKSLKRLSTAIKTSTCELYKYQYNQQIAFQLIEILEAGRQPLKDETFEVLVLYLMRHCLIAENKEISLKLPDRWNDSVRSIFTHKNQAYTWMKNQFLSKFKGQFTSEDKQNVVDSLAQRVIRLLETRSESNDTPGMGVTLSKGRRDFKLYQLL